MNSISIKCGIPEFNLIIKSSNKELLHLVKGLFSMFTIDDSYIVNNNDFVISVENKSLIYIIKYNGKILKSRSKEVFMTNILYLSERYLETLSDRYIFFHGGAVAKNDKVYIFMAPTTTGKSTMLVNMTINALNYLSDDIIVVDRNNLSTLYSFPLPIKVRTLKYINNDLISNILFEYSNEYYITNLKTCDKKYQFKKFYILDRFENCSTEIINMKSIDVYQYLLKSLKTEKNLITEMYYCLKLAKSINGYIINYSNSHDVIEKILEEEKDEKEF